jgi:hypothetical protein
MKLSNISQPPFQTTLMGVLKGALDYHGIGHSDAAAFGGSGHAFLINVHDEICPSGPYCWRYDSFWPLVRNVGLEVEDLGFFHGQSGPEERKAVEAKLRAALDAGVPCSMMNMENQLVTGYDDDRLLLAQPWECSPEVTPATLTFGTWAELGDEVHVNFFVLRKAEPAPRDQVIRDSLRWACALHFKPDEHSIERYGVGPRAYDNWAKAVEKGMGGSHGNWWNAEVWSECRLMASAWFRELSAADRPTRAELARLLVKDYAEIGELLKSVGDKTMPIPEKVSTIVELKARELRAVAHIETYLAVMNMGPGASRTTPND